VDVVGHQAIRVHGAAALGGKRAKVQQVQEVIAVVPEARLSIVATLNYVHGDIRDDEPGLARHAPEKRDSRRPVDLIGL
jgi:hypothetical protein